MTEKVLMNAAPRVGAKVLVGVGELRRQMIRDGLITERDCLTSRGLIARTRAWDAAMEAFG